MEYKKSKRKKSMIITKIDYSEFLCCLKTNIQMSLMIFDKDTLELGKTFILTERSKKRNVPGSTVITEFEGETTSSWFSFEDINDMIKNYIETNNIIQIEIDLDSFYHALPLIELYNHIPDNFATGLVMMEHKDGLFHFEFASKNNLPNDIFYWQATRDLFGFTEDGPQFSYKTDIKSVRELIELV